MCASVRPCVLVLCVRARACLCVVCSYGRAYVRARVCACAHERAVCVTPVRCCSFFCWCLLALGDSPSEHAQSATDVNAREQKGYIPHYYCSSRKHRREKCCSQQLMESECITVRHLYILHVHIHQPTCTYGMNSSSTCPYATHVLTLAWMNPPA